MTITLKQNAKEKYISSEVTVWMQPPTGTITFFFVNIISYRRSRKEYRVYGRFNIYI